MGFSSDVDYTVVGSVVTFAIGEVEACREIVMIVDDSLSLEREETIVVSFTPPPGTQQGTPSTSTITILDNDGETIFVKTECLVILSLLSLAPHGVL